MTTSRATPDSARRAGWAIAMMVLGGAALAASLFAGIHQDRVREALPAWWKAFMPLGVLGFLWLLAGLLVLVRTGRAAPGSERS